MDNDAERWKAELKSLVAEQDMQTREWQAMRRVLQDLLRGLLNSCVGWSAAIDEEIEVFRIQVERAATAAAMDDLQRTLNRICNQLAAVQRGARNEQRDLAGELAALREQFTARLAEEPVLAACIEAPEAVSTEDGIDAFAALADRVVDAFRQLSAQKTEAERFVSEVTATVASLESWTSGESMRVDAQRIAHKDLHADVDREVSSLKTDVDRSDSLDDLKVHMRQRFAAIATRIRRFRDSEEEKLQAAEAQNARLAHELAELKLRTESLSEQLHEQQALLLLDTLTNVHSRFAYERRLDAEMAAAMRNDKPLCFALWDIDHFKRINDALGHQAGDAVLRQVAGCLSRYTRSSDFVARIGGEEFVVLFPDTRIEDATMIAEKLRLLIASADYRVSGHTPEVTISCGLSLLQPGDGAEQLYQRADAALYAAKHAGRNRCMAA